VTGMLTGISLPTTLQMLNFEKRDGVIRVDAREGSGELTLVGGEIINAVTGNLHGTEAAAEILSWTDVTVEIRNTWEPVEREIFQPLHQLLMDAYRLRDEIEEQPKQPEPKPTTQGLLPGRVNDLLGTKTAVGANRDYSGVLARVRQLKGLSSATIFDFDNGLIADLPPGQTDASVSHFWEARDRHVDQLALLNAVTSQRGAQDGLLVYSTHYHVFRPVTKDRQVFIYLTLDRATANLVEARQTAQQLTLG
jgi:hypothetical protein